MMIRRGVQQQMPIPHRKVTKEELEAEYPTQQSAPGKETPEGTWVSDKEFWGNPKVVVIT
jgi:hypothetical protein